MVQPEKKAMVKEIEEKLEKAKGTVLTDYRGLKVEELDELRQNLRKENIEYKVFKNRLIKLAAKKHHLEELEKYLEGPTALTFGYEDSLKTIKRMASFAKEHEALEIKAGILEKEVVDATYLKKLAALPEPEELVVKLINQVKSPFYGLARVLNNPAISLIATLREIAQAKT